MAIAIAATSALVGCSHGISKGELADAINESIGKEKVCFVFEDKNTPTWPVKIGEMGEPPSIEDPTGVLTAMQGAGYVNISREKEPYKTGNALNTIEYYDVDVITLTEQAKGWWNVPDGFCVGRKAVADTQEWTLPGKDSGAPAQETKVKDTWHLTDVPSWAQRPEFKNIEGMATPVQNTARLWMTNNGWRASGDGQ